MNHHDSSYIFCICGPWLLKSSGYDLCWSHDVKRIVLCSHFVIIPVLLAQHWLNTPPLTYLSLIATSTHSSSSPLSDSYTLISHMFAYMCSVCHVMSDVCMMYYILYQSVCQAYLTLCVSLYLCRCVVTCLIWENVPPGLSILQCTCLCISMLRLRVDVVLGFTQIILQNQLHDNTSRFISTS